MNTSASESSIACTQVPCGRTSIHGELAIPEDARGLVVFAHATRGGWTNTSNWAIAWKIHHAGYATLLLDLLTPEEATLETAKEFLGSEVALLTERLVAAIRWARSRKELADLPVACFASEAAAAAALHAAVLLPEIRTVIGRAARTDLVDEPEKMPSLPVLLVVGENDRRTLRSNREYTNYAPARHVVRVIPGATHRFPERGALGQVANLSLAWLEQKLPKLMPSVGKGWSGL
ncbi:alpha/beta hydrolase [Haloferula sp. BvORR071]|uniref:dienelactone hydrolase family protein n=1 Tax=Haloferula sp. BvORR071 TaxID=1396141 RepID=UPI000696221D|nr:alpha/beta hydrolase [Haloferula sp. BvORR071]